MCFLFFAFFALSNLSTSHFSLWQCGGDGRRRWVIINCLSPTHPVFPPRGKKKHAKRRVFYISPSSFFLRNKKNAPKGLPPPFYLKGPPGSKEVLKQQQLLLLEHWVFCFDILPLRTNSIWSPAPRPQPSPRATCTQKCDPASPGF